jgi:hypothetical protein
MSISSTKNSSPATSREPLESLLETIQRAHQLIEAGSFEPRSLASGSGDDPLAGLRQTIAAETTYQSTTALDQWTTDGGPADDRDARASTAELRGDQSQTSAASGVGSQTSDAGAEARVGREVLAMLREQPLSGPARASAVEQLAAQIDSPDASALRDVLAILVTGQSS